MRKLLSFLFLFTIAWTAAQNPVKPEVFVFTDINIEAGDPDDRQSMVHLLWYADELQIEGIVPDAWNRQGREATMMALDAYTSDYRKYGFGEKGYPDPRLLADRIAADEEDAIRRLKEAAIASDEPV